MRVFVTGATGAIGSPSVDALVAAGHEVTAMVRTDAKAAAVRARGATPVMVSLFDGGALAAAVAGHDAVVNLATALPATHRFTSMRAWKENIRIRAEGSRTVAESAVRAGVPRMLQESVSMIYPDRGGDWITENIEPDRYPMAESNLAAESSARWFTDQGGVGVVMRFGWFYGPGAGHSEQFLALASRHVCVQMGGPGGYVSSIHIRDGGRAVAAGLDVPAGVYNVVDDEPLTKAEYAEALASATGTRCWLRVPGRFARLLGHRTTSLTRSVRVSNEKLRRATNWRPEFASAREGLTQSALALGIVA
ncbi:MAG: NAD(P)-dependent oxidoreductase [Acidimicrobiales bacterium]|nr:NAD(P)-dependent oxidoreductase [Acidimicrobiales bacterium]